VTDPVQPAGSSESRPRPAYGEYATPEEQRARIQRPDLTYLLETGQDPDAAAATGHGEPGPAFGQVGTQTAPAAKQGAPAVPRASAKPAPRSRFADRVATIALLVYGLVNVVTSVPAIIDYDTYVTTVLSVLGVDGQLADPAVGRGWAVAAAVVLVLGWLLTALVSWRRLSRGRLTWWIPLVAGVVFTIVSGALLMVPIMSDPTLWQTILDSTR
jgi:Family of unknown function (DUF6264)